MLGQVVRVPEQILLLEFENQYYAAKVKPVLKEVAGCWLVPVFEVRVESAEAAKSALPSFPKKWDEERKVQAKERLGSCWDRCVPCEHKRRKQVQHIVREVPFSLGVLPVRQQVGLFRCRANRTDDGNMHAV